MPFWIYSPKLIETMFRQTASASAMFTGTFALLASAGGILVSGFVITKYKPRARYLSFWNVIVGISSVLYVISFSFMGCEESRNSVNIDYDSKPSCNADCHCDFVRYSPVCGADGSTYISACHAGCASISVKNGTKTFDECSCIEAVIHHEFQQTAKTGPCPIDCKTKLMIFLSIMCVMKFIGASGRASNFLVGIRCVEERDKTLAIGLGMSMVRLLASVPSPIVFGYLIDR
jgi:Organic Anion Transporter Polypeptide (OATP) family/Kazal-type serine protease inhibitor domain